MEGKIIYKLKADVTEFKNLCSYTQNRVIEKMIECNEEASKHMASYLRCLLVNEALGNYISLLCCKLDSVSFNMIKELNLSCKRISKCIKMLEKHLPKNDQKYVRLAEIKRSCSKCSNYYKLKKHSKKK